MLSSSCLRPSTTRLVRIVLRTESAFGAGAVEIWLEADCDDDGDNGTERRSGKTASNALGRYFDTALCTRPGTTNSKMPGRSFDTALCTACWTSGARALDVIVPLSFSSLLAGICSALNGARTMRFGVGGEDGALVEAIHHMSVFERYFDLEVLTMTLAAGRDVRRRLLLIFSCSITLDRLERCIDGYKKIIRETLLALEMLGIELTDRIAGKLLWIGY